jgi:TATA-box binding protein (TBP) (component of TFIID and TFIIIB)
MEATTPEIRNIKAHFSIKKKNLKHYLHAKCDLKQISIKFYHNFFVIREKYVYIIWYKCGFVNVTKIKSENDIICALNHFCTTFDIYNVSDGIIVDNITASGKINQFINLKKLSAFLIDQHFEIKYNKFKFPAIFVKIYKFGTLTIFGSGSFNIIGCRSMTDLSAVYIEGIRCIKQWKERDNVISV